jgi:hypothetical protein
MKLAFILILGVVGEVQARSFTLSNTTGTTRSTVSFTATFRPAPTTTTTSSSTTTSSTSYRDAYKNYEATIPVEYNTDVGSWSDGGAAAVVATPEELGYKAPTVNYRTYESPELTSMEQQIYSGKIDSTWSRGEVLDASTYTNPYTTTQPVTTTYKLPAEETLWATSPENTFSEPARISETPLQTTRDAGTATYTKSVYE